MKPELAMIIQQYNNVFEKPHGLPPIRSHDHTILPIDAWQRPCESSTLSLSS